MKSFTITVISSFDQWGQISSQWNQILGESASATIFLTWEWLMSWAECCLGENRTLFILACYEKDQLMGVAPFYIENKKYGIFSLREIHFLGTPESGSDSLDVFSKKGWEKEVASAVYDFLMGSHRTFWDTLVLTDIRANSLFALYILNIFEANGKYVEIRRCAYCPVLKLPSSLNDLYLSLSSSFRKSFKQHKRVAIRDYDFNYFVINKKKLAEKLDEFSKFYNDKSGWNSGKIFDIFNQLIIKTVNDPPLQIDFLSIDGQVVAGLLHLKYQKTISLYLMAVDKKINPKISFGNIIVGNSIEKSIESKYHFYDFLKGNEGYKFHWTSNGISTIKILFWQSKMNAIFFAYFRILKNILKIAIR